MSYSARPSCGHAVERTLQLSGHDHLSDVAVLNTPDEQLGLEVLDFMRRGK